MANGLYKLTTKMRYLGQAIVNTFWYRSVLEGTFATDVLIDGAKALGDAFINRCWEDHWRALVPTDCYFDGVVVDGFNDNFELLYSNPVQVLPNPLLDAGTANTDANWLRPADVVNVAFYLKNRLIVNPLFPAPKKGLVALSPVNHQLVGEDGTLTDEGAAVYQAVADDFASPLPWNFASVDFPFTSWEVGVGLANAFIPVRVRLFRWNLPVLWHNINVLRAAESTDVETAVARKLLGYRRSRKVEG